jgi:diguanylate cyclase (GGDEF)-like protein
MGLLKELVAPKYRGQFIGGSDVSQLIYSLKNGQPKKQIQFCTISRSGKDPLWIELTMNLYRDAKSGDIMMLAHHRDITADMNFLEKLSDMATKDLMLDIYNKKHTEELVSQTLEYSSGTLLVIDIDDFKEINDTKGHQKGDEILYRLASQIKSTIRKSDIFGRIGGDEFLVFMRGITSQDIAEAKVQEIFNNARIHVKKDNWGEDVYLSISIGACIVKEPGHQYAEIFERADKALYMSKNNGKGIYTFY